jgi:hypothetical protein
MGQYHGYEGFRSSASCAGLHNPRFSLLHWFYPPYTSRHSRLASLLASSAASFLPRAPREGQVGPTSAPHLMRPPRHAPRPVPLRRDPQRGAGDSALPDRRPHHRLRRTKPRASNHSSTGPSTSTARPTLRVTELQPIGVISPTGRSSAASSAPDRMTIWLARPTEGVHGRPPNVPVVITGNLELSPVICRCCCVAWSQNQKRNADFRE